MQQLITIQGRLRFSLALLIFLFIGLESKAQQGYSYTQYMNNQVPLNPAASLLDQNGSVNALLRKQWVGIQGAPSTFIFDASLPISSINGAAGLVVVNDDFAIEHQTEVNAFFAKGIQLSTNSFLGVSLNAGFKRYVANYSQLDANDPTFSNDIRQTKPNVGFGLMFYSDHYYVGLSAPELTFTSLGTASQQNVANFKNHYNFTGGYLFGKPGDDLRVKPAALVAYTQGIPAVVNFSTTLYIKSAFGVGADVGSNNEAAGIVSFMTGNLHLGYAYQFGTSSSALSYHNATHEVTLGIRFGKNTSPKLL